MVCEQYYNLEDNTKICIYTNNISLPYTVRIDVSMRLLQDMKRISVINLAVLLRLREITDVQMTTNRHCIIFCVSILLRFTRTGSCNTQISLSSRLLV